MTPSACVSPLDPVASAKRRLIASAHAMSPLRAVERYPWTAVGVTAASAMGLTIVASSPLASKPIGKFLGVIPGLALGLLRSPIIAELTKQYAGKSKSP